MMQCSDFENTDAPCDIVIRAENLYTPIIVISLKAIV